MHILFRPAGIAALSLLVLPAVAAPPAADSATPAASASADTPAALTLGNQVVLRLRASAGGMTPQQRVSVVEGRLADVLGTPVIKPSAVVVYTPAKGAPVIYALGRRLITVDKATVEAAGTPNAKPLDVAKQWAARFQQILPKVNWRPSNMAEPVVPAHPPLLVTADFAKVGGNKGFITLRGKTVFALHGPQHGGLTAQERADMLSDRLKRLAGKPEAAQPGGIAVKDGKTVTLQVADTPLVTVEPSEAKLYKTTPAKLADRWADNIRKALGLPDPDALPATASAKPAPMPSTSAPSTPMTPSPAPASPAAAAPPAPASPAPTPSVPASPLPANVVPDAPAPASPAPTTPAPATPAPPAP